MIKSIRRKHFSWPVPFFIILAAGTMLRFYGLDNLGLTDDEIFTAARINRSFPEMLRCVGESQFPPLHYILEYLWILFFGLKEETLRFLPAFFSSLSIAAAFLTGRWLYGHKEGLIASALLAFSPLAVLHAQNAKMYSLFWLLSTAAMLCFFRILSSKSRKYSYLYVILSILNCYTLYAGFVLLAAQNIIFWFARRKASIRQWVLGQGCIVAAIIPWILFSLTCKKEQWNFREEGSGFNYFFFLGRSFLVIIGSLRESWSSQPFKANFAETLNTFLYLLTFLFFILTSWPAHNTNKNSLFRYKNTLLLSWAFLPVIIYLITDLLFIRAELGVRYLGFVQTALLLIIARGLSAGYGKGLHATILTLLLLISGTNTILIQSRFYNDGPPDWRPLARRLETALQPEDILLSCERIHMFEYYAPNIQDKMFRIEEKNFAEKAILLAEKESSKNQNGSIYIVYTPACQMPIAFRGFQLYARETNSQDNGYLLFKKK